jgi:hypothetical protein
MAIPPKAAGSLKERTRKAYAALPADRWIELEQDALQRGLTPHELASAIILEFLDGGLIERETNDESKGDPADPARSGCGGREG